MSSNTLDSNRAAIALSSFRDTLGLGILEGRARIRDLPTKRYFFDALSFGRENVPSSAVPCPTGIGLISPKIKI